MSSLKGRIIIYWYHRDSNVYVPWSSERVRRDGEGTWLAVYPTRYSKYLLAAIPRAMAFLTQKGARAEGEGGYGWK